MKDYFRWVDSEIINLFPDLPDSKKGAVTAISSDASVITGSITERDEDGRYSIGSHGYLYSSGKYIEIHSPYQNWPYVHPTTVSGNGSVVAGWLRYRHSNHRAAFFWTSELGVVIVEDYLRNNNLGLGASKIITTRMVSYDGRTMIFDGEFGQAIPETWILTGLEIANITPSPSLIRSDQGELMLNWNRSSGFQYTIQSSKDLKERTDLSASLYGGDRRMETILGNPDSDSHFYRVSQAGRIQLDISGFNIDKIGTSSTNLVTLTNIHGFTGSYETTTRVTEKKMVSGREVYVHETYNSATKETEKTYYLADYKETLFHCY